ncbi:hypothetical protein Psta_4437 [Pirellula staleyi DSM 6068]|uniref:Uncharacterized protein n=1 Tax=Pirellula staleyi (strain ATCC 27377 / DSM 6068 / ICPB 4128) TaxID=530564 RepID=D2R5Z7_PIRSD|nr:hypothetical protein [Pirellula staleyi]ADB19082.1 hypothetical protein Psta_4437 [Pirellula staleyi DSM 6068]
MKTEETVHIALQEPNFNDLAWSTLATLFRLPDEFNPGEDEKISDGFQFLVSRQSPIRLENAYANPLGVIYSSTLNERFLRVARRLQSKWFSQFNSTLFSAGRVKRAVDEMSPIIRQLTFTGVMICNGRHVYPNHWPDAMTKQWQTYSRKRR